MNKLTSMAAIALMLPFTQACNTDDTAPVVKSPTMEAEERYDVRECTVVDLEPPLDTWPMRRHQQNLAGAYASTTFNFTLGRVTYEKRYSDEFAAVSFTLDELAGSEAGRRDISEALAALGMLGRNTGGCPKPDF